jgi:hypothetical protein
LTCDYATEVQSTVRSIVFRDGDEVEIGSRNERPTTRYFPEVVAAVLANFPPRAVIDGEIVVADTAGNRLDFEALGPRIHPADSRVRLLAEQTPASFIAFDLLALGDVDTRARDGDPRAVARLITLVESNHPRLPELAAALAPGDRHRPGDRADRRARQAVFSYLNYYNQNRLHSTFKQQTPYEARVRYRQTHRPRGMKPRCRSRGGTSVYSTTSRFSCAWAASHRQPARWWRPQRDRRSARSG